MLINQNLLQIYRKVIFTDSQRQSIKDMHRHKIHHKEMTWGERMSLTLYTARDYQLTLCITTVSLSEIIIGPSQKISERMFCHLHLPSSPELQRPQI